MVSNMEYLDLIKAAHANFSDMSYNLDDTKMEIVARGSGGAERNTTPDMWGMSIFKDGILLKLRDETRTLAYIVCITTGQGWAQTSGSPCEIRFLGDNTTVEDYLFFTSVSGHESKLEKF